jgi:site-specific DNA recombinase
MRYILYARKSSESEDRQVQSVDDQLRVLRDLARRERLTVVAELTHPSVQKAIGGRGAELPYRLLGPL